MVQLYQGDCLELMKNIPDGSVDMVLCDLPYGALNKRNPHAAWDKPLPFEDLWREYLRVTKENAAIVLFASGMFTVDLINSNRKLWKYNLIWKKGNRPTGFLNANRQPLRITEDICVFYRKQPTYNPQFTLGEKAHRRGAPGNSSSKGGQNGCYGEFGDVRSEITNQKYPLSLIDIPKEHPQKYHTTQKPVALLKYLVKTYTNPGDVVLDNCMGSGSTGIACVRTGRRFIGMELNEKYYQTATERIAKESV